jgi:transcriptional regulator with XRE-family HTH domain
MRNVATVVREARRRGGLTQTEVARRLGTSQAAVAKLERPGANPTIATLDRVLSATGHRLEVRAAARPSSVDDTLIASYLRMSPAERLMAFQSSHDSIARLRAAARSDA